MKQIVVIPENIKYIALELVDKNAISNSCDIIAGLFKGLAVLKSNDITQLFILLSGRKEDTTEIYNTKYYNTLSLTVLGKDTKAITYFTTDEKDQDMAIKSLKELVDVITEENRMLEFDPDIIDISTYSDIPNDVGKIYKTNNESCTVFNNKINNNTDYVQKEPEPTLIKRTKTKKPTKEELLILAAKIKDIKDGVFVNTFPETKGDEAINVTNCYEDYMDRDAYRT